MRIAAMFSDVIRSAWRKPATRKYPFMVRPAPVRLRGKLIWNPEKCSGCALCTKDCPSDAITLVVNDKQTKTFVMRYEIDRCTFCAQCVQSCRFKCISLANDQWELAALSREPFTIYYGRPENIESFKINAAGTASTVGE
jgi:formate hydrogenlyase subunit 6/NADH:ubiquinone oxidoreductase subunit I